MHVLSLETLFKEQLGQKLMSKVRVTVERSAATGRIRVMWWHARVARAAVTALND